MNAIHNDTYIDFPQRLPLIMGLLDYYGLELTERIFVIYLVLQNMLYFQI